MAEPIRLRASRQPCNLFELNRRVLASDLTLAEKAVLLVILDHARHGLSVCTASTRTIAREARVTERHVRTVLVELDRRLLIMVERVGGSVHSRHVIRIGPCIHQVGTEFSLRIADEVGTEIHQVGTESRRAGDPQPYSSKEKDSRKAVFSRSDEGPESEELRPEEIDPQTMRWFGHLLPGDAKG